MTRKEYQRAMDSLTPDAGLKGRIAAKLEAEGRRRPSGSVRRAAASVLAAAAVLACLTTAALAVSPELRTAVLTFFRLEEREQMPDPDKSPTGLPEGPNITQDGVGQTVKVEYIRLEGGGWYGYQAGLLNQIQWDETNQEIQSVRFWKIQGGTPVEVPLELRSTQVDVTWRGLRYQGEVRWLVHEGELFTLTGETRFYDEDREQEGAWYIRDIPGRTDAVWLEVSQGRQVDYASYPLLLHLDTGETEDLLAGTGAEELEFAYDYSWSEDLQRVLITCALDIDRSCTWLCDRKAGALVRLDGLVGMEEAGALFGAADNTLVLYAFTRDGEGVYQKVSCWLYDLSTKQMRQTLAETPCFHSWDEESWGAMTYGRRCVRVSRTGQTWVVDLETGEETRLEGFTFAHGDNFMISPAGDRLLYYRKDLEAEGLGIAQIGVADLEEGTFLAFDREGYEKFYEGGVGWSGDREVTIRARSVENETPYLIRYEF